MKSRSSFWGSILLGACALGCGDPLRDERIASLGPEQAGFPPGELHRPGQPCALCHAAGGTAPEMAFGGTLFHRPANGNPYLIGGWRVRVEDAAGRAVVVSANRCGNFFAWARDVALAFPLRVRVVAADGSSPAPMKSLIHRERSCGGCHVEPRGPIAAGVVSVPGPDADFARPAPGECPLASFVALVELPEQVRP